MNNLRVTLIHWKEWFLSDLPVKLFYLILTGSIMLPLLGPGFIFATDMVFGPHISVPPSSNPSYLFYALLHILNSFTPSPVLEKGMLATILTLAGYGMHQFLLTQKPSRNERDWMVACLFAGTLYMINPFTYDRFMTGQYGVLFGYALLPWLAIVTWSFYARPTMKRALKITLLGILISIVSMQMIFLAMLLCVAMLSTQIYRHRQDRSWWLSFATQSALILLLFVILSSYWLLPLIEGSGVIAQTITGFSAGDQQAFAANGSHLGVMGNILALHGFWAETKNLYIMPEDIFRWWLLPIVGLWLLVVMGTVRTWRDNRLSCISFSLLLLISGVLAAGTVGTPLASFNETLGRFVPFFMGYREPQKFVALLALVFAYFGAWGTYHLSCTLRRVSHQRVVYGVLLIPVFSAPLIFWGGAGQLRTSNYPPDWYYVNTVLTKQDQGRSYALFLPWHLYMPFRFSGTVIANPAPGFFSIPVLSSQNPEIGHITAHYTDSTERAADTLITNHPENNPYLTARLSQLHVRYIILAKEDDYKRYDFLQHTSGLSLYLHTTDLLVYQVIEKGK